MKRGNVIRDKSQLSPINILAFFIGWKSIISILMIDSNNDILQLRFEGNGISPDTVKPSEISELIIEFQNAILSTIKQDYEGIDTNEVLFTLDAIKNESLGINFKPVSGEKVVEGIKNAVVNSYLLIATSINTGDFTKLNTNTIFSLKKISKFSKDHGCNGQFNYNGINISTITPHTEIKEIKASLIKSNTKVYGEITDVGNNIHLKLNEGYSIMIDVDKATSKQLGSRLWDQVGLIGTAKWDPFSNRIIEFKLSEILDYNPGSISGAFAELRKASSGAWDEFNSNEKINQHLLRD